MTRHYTQSELVEIFNEARAEADAAAADYDLTRPQRNLFVLRYVEKMLGTTEPGAVTR